MSFLLVYVVINVRIDFGKYVFMKKLSWFLLFIISFFITSPVFSDTTIKAQTFKATARITGTGTLSFSIEGIYKIADNQSVSSVTWSTATNDKCYQQSDCYVVFRSTVTEAHSKIRIYTDVKNQSNYGDRTVSSYTGSLTNYFNGLVGQGENGEPSFSVLPLAWHASTKVLDPNVEDDRKQLDFADKEYDIDGNKNPGNWSYAYMLDKSDEGFESNDYTTVQSSRGLRVLGDPNPDNYDHEIVGNAKSYLYIGCNFSNAMPTVDYAAVIILEAFTE